jgi:hypothetical protein
VETTQSIKTAMYAQIAKQVEIDQNTLWSPTGASLTYSAITSPAFDASTGREK